MRTNVTVHEEYVLYRRGDRKLYRAILNRFGKARVSRKKFIRARDAVDYRDEVMERYARMKSTAEAVNG